MRDSQDVRHKILDEFYGYLIKGLDEISLPVNLVNALGDIDPDFSLRGRVGGKAIPMHTKDGVVTQQFGVQFNLEMACDKRNNLDEYINKIVPHEVAHLIVFAKQQVNAAWKKERGHGKYWKHVMIKLGVPSNKITRTHNFEVIYTRKLKRYVYVCPDCGENFNLTKHKHNQCKVQIEHHGHTLFFCPCQNHIPSENKKYLEYSGKKIILK